MRKLLLILTAIAFIACKDDKKNTTDTNSKTEEVKKQVVSKVEEIREKFSYNTVENLLGNPDFINLTSRSHAFTDNIVFKEVNVLKTGEDTYSLIIVFDEKATDFEAYNQWKLAIIATPKDPSQFLDKKEQKKGARTTGIGSEPVVMGNEIVLHTPNFKIKPKEFSFIRFYLYNFQKEVNTKYYLIKDATLPY